MTQKQLKEERRLLYNSNQEKYNKAILVSYGGLLALIDYIEVSNEVFPEFITDNLKKEVNRALNNLYYKQAGVEVSEEHNEIAELFRKVINENIQ